MNKKTIFICDDHQLFREGIKYIVTKNGYEIAGEASNGKELLQKLEAVQPDIILLDINMPEMNGIEAAKIILKNNPKQSILILSMHDSEKYYNNFIELGIRGFLLKNSSNYELLSAIEKIEQGEAYFSQSLLLKILKNKDTAKVTVLSKREKEILQYICLGFTNFNISEKLHIAPRTVERHRANLLKKTKTSNSIKLVLYALQNNIVTI
ncbi:MAG: response regulator transcription factor [Bacteroidales bacterium]|jgi:DNA-binding NarL/FixJ family response regulator|nr:response regulator transcription factor [Bacteroidales bacterium]